MKTIEKLLAKSNNNQYSFAEAFNAIIKNHLSGYDGNPKQHLKSFCEDLQRGGCMSGLISEFIYNADCKEFYIEHIDDLEELKEDLENSLGEPIKNRFNAPNYTFVVWLCFEEYVNDLYCEIFEN